MFNYSIDTHQYKAQLLSFFNPAHIKLIEQYWADASIEKIDTINLQLREYIKITQIGKALNDHAINQHITELLNDQPIKQYGVWAYYQWSRKLVHILPKEAFVEVRTNRNKLKITKEEQQSLENKKVGIIGLSVGQSVAITMAMERICGELRIADFDTLDLSNMNRLRGRVDQLGMPKVIIAAQQIAEIDPYLNITLFPEGITEQNLDAFLGNGANKLDVLVEVCDGLDIKIKARKAARKKLIPVIMDTSDRGMIDIERFDLEPLRPLFHGLINEDIDLAKLDTNERLKVLMRLVSFEDVSTRLKESMNVIGKTISTWPQLGSSVTVGGGVTCDVIRRILLNQLASSGRFYIDLETLIA